MADHFDLKVQQHIERLTQHSCRAIEAEVARKRIAWCKHNVRPGHYPDRPTPRQAFELFFFDYLKLPKSELRVVSESATEIVWLSLNPCPTLIAAQRLGLDTRQICRAAYEKSTQAFLSQLDPQLRFLRSYEEIRPYAAHCKEMIVRVDFEAMLRIAIEEAAVSKQDGSSDCGAVIVLGQRILAQARHAGLNDFHAEVSAMQEAAQVLGDSNLSGAILFSTCEPGPTCLSVAEQFNVTSIVYGVSNDGLAQLGKPRSAAHSIEPDASSSVMIEIVGHVLHAECRSLFS
jgi:tRNA(Arg) A34 adenosine deaminase TadA